MKKRLMPDAIKQERREFDLALARLKQLTKTAEKHFVDIATVSKKAATETTMSQEEATYYLSHKLMERAKTGNDLEIGFDC